MKSYLSIVIAASLAFAGVVQAHAKLEKSVPAADSTLTSVPKNVELVFDEAVQLTALTLQAGAAKAQDIGPLPKAPSSKVAIPLPVLTAGGYTLTWRAVSDDGHVMSGKIQFKVGTTAQSGTAH